MSILLLLVATGCSDPDESGGNPGLTAPVVVSVAPLSGASGTCINTIVTATFSKAMNPATINSTTFTLTGPSGTAELGQVTYNVASNTAIFAPAAALAPNTLYTAAISTRARDVFGIGLANRMVWSFTTGAGACSGVGAPAVVSATPANRRVQHHRHRGLQRGHGSHHTRYRDLYLDRTGHHAGERRGQSYDAPEAKP